MCIANLEFDGLEQHVKIHAPLVGDVELPLPIRVSYFLNTKELRTGGISLHHKQYVVPHHLWNENAWASGINKGNFGSPPVTHILVTVLKLIDLEAPFVTLGIWVGIQVSGAIFEG